MSAGVWVLVVALVAAILFGLWRAMTDGRLRGTKAVHGSRDGAARPLDREGLRSEQSERHETDVDRPWTDQLGDRATLVQFSSAFCAPCRTTRQVLSGIADAVPGVNHVEIDAEHHLDLVRELGIYRTPTTLILDADGIERLRASGVPKRDQVLAALS